MQNTVLDISQFSRPLAPDERCGVVYRRFEDEPDSLAFAVIDGTGAPVGIVERNSFFLGMAAIYGRALYGNKPISVLMNTRPHVVEADVPVLEFCREALGERASELMQGFVVTRNGAYAGVGTALALLQATSQANRKQAEEMTESARHLQAAQTQAQAALAAKSQFLAVMSHEIRTPLNGILAIAEVMQHKIRDAQMRRYLRTISDSGETLMRLLNDALDVTRAEAGRLQLAEVPFPVAPILQDVEALWSAQAQQKGLTLSSRFDGDAGLWARGDVIRIKQILNNLMSNALKFTDEGGVEVVVAAERSDTGIAFEASVRDTGIGLPEGAETGIFTPFNHSSNGLARGGAGLGLSVCLQLARQMNGDIRAMPNPDGGSTFRLTLSLQGAEAPGATSLGDSIDPPLSRPLHVLIADDNATNRLVASTLCEMFGCTCEIVEDGEQAVDAARSQHFDLILMDIKMPRMDGIEATRQIRASPLPLGDIPIVALTANADAAAASLYLAQGMDAVAAKPIGVESLLGAIEQALAAAPRRGLTSLSA